MALKRTEAQLKAMWAIKKALMSTPGPALICETKHGAARQWIAPGVLTWSLEAAELARRHPFSGISGRAARRHPGLAFRAVLLSGVPNLLSLSGGRV